MASADKQSDDVLCSRSSDYQPPLPEVQSSLSRLIVKIELGLIALIILGLGARFYQAHRPDNRPVKVASMHSTQATLSALPADFGASSDASSIDGADPVKGQVLYMQTCTACHGQQLQGMPHQGVSLRDSKFISTTPDLKLVAFLKMGRKPADAKNTTGLLMPARGGNPALDDDALANIVAFLRQVQKETNPAVTTQAAASAAPATRPVAAADSQSAGAGARE